MITAYSDGVYKMLAIDPGGHKCGVSLFTFSLKEKNILSIESFTINVEKLKNDTGFPEELLRNKFLAYYKLRNEILRLLLSFKPDIIGYEAPFMNSKQPSAYGPLVSMMTLIYDAVITYNLGSEFYTIQPQQTKKAVGVAGKKTKVVVVEAVKKVPELMGALSIDIDTLDDNAVDSIAVGWYVLKHYLYKNV